MRAYSSAMASTLTSCKAWAKVCIIIVYHAVAGGGIEILGPEGAVIIESEEEEAP